MSASTASAPSAGRSVTSSARRRAPTGCGSRAAAWLCACRRVGRWPGCDPRASVAKESSFGEAIRLSGVYRDVMPTRISHTFIYVLDQDEALDFYVGKLGMVVNTDADLGTMRWLTVTLADQPDLQLALMRPGLPVHDDATAEQIRELVAKGAAPAED